ncbi:MAG: MmcQ/YjbR family DNA-binding protein [Candidatus Dormibacteraeota bacterium]|nr:MmcQ/YjbR family DNA-binding protein [Candidatus Dormibacteraeota bacterium]
MGKREFDRVRKIALALPEVNERLSHGAPCFFIQDRPPLCYYHDNHRDDGRISVWCPAPPGVPEELVSAEPERFFEPPASATGVFSRWLGVYLETGAVKKVDWNEVATILEDAYRNVAPQKLVTELDHG